MNDEKILRSFCESHDIRILDSHKKRAIRSISPKFFSNEYDYNNVVLKEEFATEDIFTLEISHRELTKISQFESQVFNHMRQQGHYDLFNYMMEQKEEEKLLRKKYPAVQRAYEQYSLMLKMAESGEL
jgi:hypothetical protein